MRTAHAVAGVMAAVWPLAAVQAQTTSSRRECQFAIRGRVVDRDVETPIGGAVIVSSAFEQSVRTAADGGFRIENLCIGEVPLTVSKTGFEPGETTVSVPFEGELLVRLGYVMQTVTITAPLADPLAELGFRDEIDGQDLLETRGLSLADALRDASGVQVVRSGAVAKPVIDGFFGNRILILNDGLRHHGQLWSLDHAPEVDPFGANRLTVVRGAEGVRYGTDAIGGVILIEPPPFIDPDDPVIVRGEGNLVGMVNGLQGIANLGLATVVPWLPELSVRARGSVKKAGSLYAPTFPLDNTGAEEFSGEGALRYRGQGWLASATVRYFESRYGIFPGIRVESRRDFEDAITRDEPRNVRFYEFSYDIERNLSQVDHLYARGEINLDVGSWGTLALLYGYQDNDRREFEVPRVPTTEPQLVFRLESHALELTLDHRFSDFVGVVGVSGLLQNNDFEGVRRLIPDYDRTIIGAFALERYRGENFDLAVGLRYERQSMDVERPTAIDPDNNPPERFDLDFEAVMATLGASYTPDPAWTFDMHLAAASRIPTPNELFIDGLVPGEPWFELGNPDLSPETTFNVGLGIGFAHRWLDAEVTAYVHVISDYIYRVPLFEDGVLVFQEGVRGGAPASEYRNIDALFAGGTVEFAVHPFEWIEWTSRATYVRARNLRDGSFIVNVPTDRYENRLTYRPPKLGPLYDNAVWLESMVVLEQFESDPVVDLARPPPTYHLLNAGLATAFSLGPQEIRANVDLHNLLNTRYRDYISRLRFFADEPGFNAIVRLSFPIDIAGADSKDRIDKE